MFHYQIITIVWKEVWKEVRKEVWKEVWKEMLKMILRLSTLILESYTKRTMKYYLVTHRYFQQKCN